MSAEQKPVPPVVVQQRDLRPMDPATRALVMSNAVTELCEFDIEKARKIIGEKMVISSAPFMNVMEGNYLDSLTGTMNNMTGLKKEVYLNQRLSNEDKSRLLKFWSPPYKLNFSANPSDIGSHMYYRSLNEIGTFRCYDLLNCEREGVPCGYDPLIKEVGANIPKIIKYSRRNVHACTPNLSVDDSIRITNTEHHLTGLQFTGTKLQKELYKNYDIRYRCKNKSQLCCVKCLYIILAHSAYDCTTTNLADIMCSSVAVMAVGFIHYSKKVLANLPRRFQKLQMILIQLGSEIKTLQ
jgi:hypothetical protein